MYIKIDDGTDLIIFLCVVIPWLFGVVIAKGFWVTCFAVIFPPYAWYLVIEQVCLSWGII